MYVNKETITWIIKNYHVFSIKMQYIGETFKVRYSLAYFARYNNTKRKI